MSVRPARTCAVAVVCALAALVMTPAGPVEAQRSLDVRPVVSLTDDRQLAFGARWVGMIESGETTRLALSFPHKAWWAVRGKGAWLPRAGVAPEPIIDGDAELGLHLLLLKQRPCRPNDCPPNLVRFDLGYIVLGVRIQGESDDRADEMMAAAGGTLLYRPPPTWSGKGLGFVVPTISLGAGIAWPLRSTLRETLGVADDSFERLDTAFGWTIRFARDWVPAGLRPLRLDTHLAHFSHRNLEDAIVDSVGASGKFVAFDVGYELTDKVRFVRHVFVRWSEGTHATLPTGRKGWLLGVTLGIGRRRE